MIFNAGVNGINQQMASVLKLQQQIAANRRIVTPADDPVAAAQALQVQQAGDVNSQFATNISNATSALGLEHTQLEATSDIFKRVKELTIQAGNAALSTSDRNSIAVELRARFDDLLGIANSKDASGQYVFAGYKGNTQPFVGTVEGGVSYLGDDGQRALQVSASRLLETSDSGSDVFERITNGNGIFSTTYGTNFGTSGPNLGSGVISGGAVVDPSAWVPPASASGYEVRFSVSGGVTTYQIYDGATALLAPPGTYTSGQAIALQQTTPTTVDFGASVTVTGTPADGDSFTVSSSTSQSVFDSLARLIRTVEAGNSSAADSARYQVDLNNSMTNLDRASTNILQVSSLIGSRLNELESLSSINSDVDLQYKETLSNLQDLDLVQAYTDVTRKKTEMEAAQKSFVATSSLSLFNYI
jgi:flagellar hook-associated protein 3 FlgL